MLTPRDVHVGTAIFEPLARDSSVSPIESRTREYRYAGP